MTNIDGATAFPLARIPGNNASDFLNVTETAELLRISPVTLCRWRTEGVGPPFRRFGRRVVYSRS